MTLAAIISFCTTDYRFLDRCLKSALFFSQQVIVSISDHFFDCVEENYTLLEEIYRKYPQVQFLEYAFSTEKLYGTSGYIVPRSPDWGHHWHNTSRLIGYHYLENDIEEVLFLDVDEIVDEERFKEWFKNGSWRGYDAMRLACYCYFREAKYRATTIADWPLLFRKEALDPQWLINLYERRGLFLLAKGKTAEAVKGDDRKPLVHHYSWVRSEEEMRKKVHSWAHHWEREWPALITEEFKRSFNGKDFVRCYEYEEVEPFWDPLAFEIKRPVNRATLEEHRIRARAYPNVRLVNHQDIFRKEVEQMLQ